MQVSILGSGAIGHAIATQFARAGEGVVIANRKGPESMAALAKELGPNVRPVTLAEAIAADVVILAVPFTGVAEALAGAPAWAGRIVVDATNAIDFPGFTPTDLGGRPSTEVVAEAAPGAKVVKAFNSLPAAVLESDPAQGERRRVLFVSGNDDGANRTVAGLIEKLGFAPVVLGALGAGGLLQQFGGPLTVIDLAQAVRTN